MMTDITIMQILAWLGGGGSAAVLLAITIDVLDELVTQTLEGVD